MNDYMTDEAGAAEEQSEPAAEKSATKTALLPIDFFQGKELNPGDTCSVQIEKVEDDQVQVKYLSEGAEEKSEEQSSEAAPPVAEGGGAGQDMMM